MVCACNIGICVLGQWGTEYFCGLLCGEIAAVKRAEEEEKQRKKAKLAAKLRKLMKAEEKSEKKRCTFVE